MTEPGIRTQPMDNYPWTQVFIVRFRLDAKSTGRLPELVGVSAHSVGIIIPIRHAGPVNNTTDSSMRVFCSRSPRLSKDTDFGKRELRVLCPKSQGMEFYQWTFTHYVETITGTMCPWGRIAPEILESNGL